MAASTPPRRLRSGSRLGLTRPSTCEFSRPVRAGRGDRSVRECADARSRRAVRGITHSSRRVARVAFAGQRAGQRRGSPLRRASARPARTCGPGFPAPGCGVPARPGRVPAGDGRGWQCRHGTGARGESRCGPTGDAAGPTVCNPQRRRASPTAKRRSVVGSAGVGLTAGRVIGSADSRRAAGCNRRNGTRRRKAPYLRKRGRAGWRFSSSAVRDRIRSGRVQPANSPGG